jgi:thermosome
MFGGLKMSNNVQPIFIMPEDTKRTHGRDAQKNNIAAAIAVAQTVRTTLGPKGMDKMIVDSVGDVIVTNDGVTILREIQIEHPAAKMVVEVAKTQEDAVGDGTTSAVVIAGELLKRAEELIDQDIHPTILARGFRLAQERALLHLKSIAKPIGPNDISTLENIAITAMTGKGAEANRELLAKMVVKSVIDVSEVGSGLQGEKTFVDLDNIKVEKIVGNSTDESELVSGIVLDKEIVHSSMPKRIDTCRIALVDSSLEIKNTEIDAKIQITDPMQLNAFLEQEERTLKEMVDKVSASGANVIFCQKGIDDLAQHFLAKKGIIALRRVRKSDMEKLARATGAKITTSVKGLNESELGFCSRVFEKKIGDEQMVFVEGCNNPKAVTLLVRGSTEHIADEIKRAVTDALGDVASALRDGLVVAGAGSCEVELAKVLKEYANTLSGREQLAVEAFSRAMEVIPRTLAENAGLDPIDVMAQLRSSHDAGQIWAGINVNTGKVMDAWEQGVIEPLKIKTHAILSASQVAQMILRIDDVILGGSSGNQGPSMPPGMGPGMGR